MADVDLDFLAHQVKRVLDENRAIRAEVRELRQGNVNLGRLLEHVRKDVGIAMKTELGGQFANFAARLAPRVAGAIEEGLRRGGPRE